MRIRTDKGEVAIECLHVGDLVVTECGESRPIRWLGFRRIECAGYRDPSQVWPVLIRKGAVSEDRPSGDLWVSPGHCLRVGDVLIQAEKLVNGVTITREQVSQVEYWHVELDRHDIVVAEGTPAESYLDTGNRQAFYNGGAFVESHPDFKPKYWRDTCLPLVTEGAELERAKSQTLERARAMGYSITDDCDAHIVADGLLIEKTRLNENRLAFVVPAGRKNIELRCRAFIPSWVKAASTDTRELGICVGRWQLDGTDVPLTDPTGFAKGWHDLEEFADGSRQRWSMKNVPIPPGTRLIVIDVAGPSYCWAAERQPSEDVGLHQING
jgi:Hint domain